MGKIVHLSSSKPARVEQSDHITKLPDELLSNIVSGLTLIEAARTSVLARRWKTLWYHFHGDLEFDETKRIRDLPINASLEANTQTVHDYLSSNRQVLQSLQSPFFDAFKVRCLNADAFCESYLDFCVQFAMKKRMKTFELDAFPGSSVGASFAYYMLPPEFNAWIKTTCGGSGNIMSSLTSISLKGVAVCDDLIHYILLNCPLIENIRLTDSFKLFNPESTGGTMKLKYLENRRRRQESIEICPPNLSTFSTAFGEAIKLLIENAPKPVELPIPVDIVVNRPKSVSSYLLDRILSIKEHLKDPQQSEGSLVELLQTLAGMDLTFKALKETDIGRHVNRLHRHSSYDVCALVKQLIRKWKDLVDEWLRVDMLACKYASSVARIGDGDSPKQKATRSSGDA